MTDIAEILDNLAKAIDQRDRTNDTNAYAAATWADELGAVARQLRGVRDDADEE
jgi:hypothetical protein